MADSERSIRIRLRAALTTAMKARDKPAVAAIRAAIAAIDNAEAVDAAFVPDQASEAIAGAAVGLGAGDVARRELTETEMVALVEAEIAVRRSTAGEYEALGQTDAAEALAAEADALAALLA